MLVSVHRHHCARCGRILDSPKNIVRGYGPSCWKIVRPQPIKPYVQEVPLVDTGGTDYMAKVYGEFENWEDAF